MQVLHPKLQLPPRLLAALVSLGWVLAGDLRAESLRRSDPETAGEKRLLEWDLNKTFDLSKGRANPSSKPPSKSFLTGIFRAGSFAPKAFPAGSFSSTEFLVPENRTRSNAYAASTYAVPGDPAKATLAKPFALKKSPSFPNFSPPAIPQQTAAPRRFEGSDRPYLGPEAARKEQRYNPENAPKGGTIEGRRLTVDEVREILNKSK